MKNDRLDIMDRLAPSEAEKEATHRVRAGYVGAPATVGRERERESEQNLWIMVITWTNWNLIRDLAWDERP
jgi:hypothetical protein